MFKFFSKPTIKAKLINNGQNSKVTLSNINATETIVLLFSIVKQVAVMLKIDHRNLINKLADLDKQMVKNKKQLERAVKYKK